MRESFNKILHTYVYNSCLLLVNIYLPRQNKQTDFCPDFDECERTVHKFLSSYRSETQQGKGKRSLIFFQVVRLEAILASIILTSENGNMCIYCTFFLNSCRKTIYIEKTEKLFFSAHRYQTR